MRPIETTFGTRNPNFDRTVGDSFLFGDEYFVKIDDLDIGTGVLMN